MYSAERILESAIAAGCKEVEICLGCGADTAKRDCGCPCGTATRLVNRLAAEKEQRIQELESRVVELEQKLAEAEAQCKKKLTLSGVYGYFELDRSRVSSKELAWVRDRLLSYMIEHPREASSGEMLEDYFPED